ncbi:MAG: hypothetical protein ACI9OU_002407, partial [Candidatus Promineifilaceae bacterium]
LRVLRDLRGEILVWLLVTKARRSLGLQGINQLRQSWLSFVPFVTFCKWFRLFLGCPQFPSCPAVAA